MTETACDGAAPSIAVDVPGTEATEPNAGQVPTPAPTNAGAPVVAFLGDSIAAGQHLAAEQAFPAVLQRRLATRGSRFQLLRAAVNGDTTEGALRRLDALLEQKPRVVVVELGAGDALEEVPIARTESNLRALVQKVQAAGARCLLLGVRLPVSQGGADYVRKLEALYPRLAQELNAAYAPLLQNVAGRPELNQPDGINPTPEGHERIAMNLEEPLLALLIR